MAVSHSLKVERCVYQRDLFASGQIQLSGEMVLNGNVRVQGVAILSSEAPAGGPTPGVAVIFPAGLGTTPLLRVRTSPEQRAELAPVMFGNLTGPFTVHFETAANLTITAPSGTAVSALRLEFERNLK